MKRTLLLALFLLVSMPSFSQEYHPLLNNTAWVVSDLVSCCRPPAVHTITHGPSVTIGDFTYTKFYNPFTASDTLYIREDVVERKVYQLVTGNEKLLYDFAMETGETVTQGSKTFIATVDEITVEVGQRKRITLETTEEFNGHILTQTWIEGVGTDAHPFDPDANMYNVMASGGGLIYTTHCVWQGPEHIYSDVENFVTDIDCMSYLSTSESGRPERAIAVSPNSFSTELTISSASEFNDATLRIYNLRGQMIREINNINGRNAIVQREGLLPGMYLIQLSQADQLIKTEKVIVE